MQPPAGSSVGKWEDAMKNQYSIALAMLTGIGVGAVAVQGLHAQAKPPVYYIAQNDVSDADAYVKEFASKVPATVKAHGGRFLVRGGKVTALDGEPPKARVVVQVYDSMEQLKGWFNSPEYQALRKIGTKYATFHTFAVEGVPD
jgi:uncharacterized protein (DUF1330 family)